MPGPQMSAPKFFAAACQLLLTAWHGFRLSPGSPPISYHKSRDTTAAKEQSLWLWWNAGRALRKDLSRTFLQLELGLSSQLTG